MPASALDMPVSRLNIEPESSHRCAGKRRFGNSHQVRSRQSPLAERPALRAVAPPHNWLEPETGLGYSGPPCACRVTPYFAQHRVARPRSSNRGSYVSLELPETSLVAPAGPSPRRLRRANPLPQPRAPVFQVVTGRGGHGLSLIVLPRQTKKTAPARLLMVPTGLSRLDAGPAKR